jgi:hypothetical protein
MFTKLLLKTVVLAATGVLIVSCSEGGATVHGMEVPYYTFEAADMNLTLDYNYKENQVITYQNQFGEQLRFKVTSTTNKKHGSYNGSFWGSYSSLEYYYDSKLVYLRALDDYEGTEIEPSLIYAFSKSGGTFRNTVNMPLYNIENATFLDEMDRPYNISLTGFNTAQKNSMTINGHVFERVVQINSVSTEPLSYAGLNKDISTVYYDYNFGIIRFDGLDGKIWQVVYP